MGLAATLIFYRPRKPPVVSCRDLADFLQRFVDLRVLENGGTRGGSFYLKYGDAIDLDDADPMPIVPTTVEGVYTTNDIDWDVREISHPLRETIDVLSASDQGIYRAYLRLGGATPEITSPLHREACAENDVVFAPDSWSIQIMPLDSGQDGEFQVGWLAIGLEGNGYPFPWTLRDIVEKAERIDGIQQVMQLCRSTWPVDPESPDATIEDGRRAMGMYWPYDDLDRAWDWYWGMQT